MIEQHFGETTPWSVGIEEELMLLDAETLELAPRSDLVVREAAALGLPGEVKLELFASIVELTTGICASVGEAMESLAGLRRGVAAIAEGAGLRVAAAGAHPVSRSVEQPITPDERFRELVEYAGTTARRQGVNGLHVHVGMPSADACMHALEGVLPWLPLVLALSANSPYFEGEETTLASTRAEILALLPRRCAPPAFRSYAEWEGFVERLKGSGLVKEYTAIWWDVRPHPRFGTLELRIPDQPTSLALTGAFAALLQALCATVLDGPPPAYDPVSRGLYDQNRWTASRFGPQAKLVHPFRDGAVTVPDLAAELLELVLASARALGTEGLLSALDPSACEGDRQLEIGRAQGLQAVCADLVERTVAFGP